MKYLVMMIMIFGMMVSCGRSDLFAADFGKCINVINKQGLHVSGYDPRVLARECAWETISRGKSGPYFKKCVVRGIKRDVKNATNPSRFVDRMWRRIKNKCA